MKIFALTISNLITIMIVCFTLNLDAQPNSLKNDFSENLKQYNLEFEMPTGFFAPDSIDRRLFIANRIILVNYQIISKDSCIRVYYRSMKQSKEQEEKISKYFPEHDITKEYFRFIQFLCENIGEEKFDEKGLKVYNNYRRKKVNADVALTYFIKLRSPYAGKYKYLNYQFIQKNYNSKVQVFQFYQQIDKTVEKELIKALKYSKI